MTITTSKNNLPDLNTSVGQVSQFRIIVNDFEVEDLLKELLTQMKVQNTHLSLITGEEFNETDILKEGM